MLDARKLQEIRIVVAAGVVVEIDKMRRCEVVDGCCPLCALCRYYVIVAWIWSIIWYVGLDPIKWAMMYILNEDGWRNKAAFKKEKQVRRHCPHVPLPLHCMQIAALYLLCAFLASSLSVVGRGPWPLETGHGYAVRFTAAGLSWPSFFGYFTAQKVLRCIGGV
jgi:hypothetical protein